MLPSWSHYTGKYDAFSILIIVIMVFFSIGMYALTSTGIIGRIAWIVESSIVPVDIPSEKISLDEGVEKVVVSARRDRLEDI